MSEKKIMISVIIPNYNKGVFITQTLESLISQTYQKWEAIIVDDGSTDSSIKIIEKYLEKDKRFKLFKRDSFLNKGPSACRNIGIKKAVGKYIVFLDSDDIYDKVCLEKRADYMEKNPNIDFAVFPIGTFYNKIGDSKHKWITPKTNHLSKFLSHYIPWTVLNPIWSRSFLITNSIYFNEDFRYLEDIVFHIDILLSKPTYSIVENCDHHCYYRISHTNENKKSLKYLENIITASLNFFKLFENRTNKKFHKLLKGTLFSIYQTICSNNPNKSERLKYHQIIKGEINNLNSLKNRDLAFLKMYTLFYRGNLHKFKGFNFLMKRLFIYT